MKIRVKLFIVFVMLLACTLLTIYTNFVYHLDTVYTHLFYIPLIFSGLWFYRKALWVAFFLSALHISLVAIDTGSIQYSAIIRSIIFFLVAYLIGYISEKRDYFHKTSIKERLLLETTLLSIGDGVISTNKFGEITIINNVAEQLTGFSKDEAIGKKVEDVFSIYNEVTGLPSENIVEKVMNTGIIHELANHTILRSKDGKERPIADSAAPIVLSDGTISGAVLVFRDYTEKYQAEKNLVAEKELAQNYLDIAGVMLIVLNTQGEITLINQKGCHIIGLSEDEIVGKNWFDNFIPKDNAKEIKSVFNDIFNNQAELVSHYENPIINSQGEERYISWDNTLIRDADNNIIGVLSSGKDITEKKQYEKELSDSNKRYSAIYNEAPIGIALIDSITGKFIEFNTNYAEICQRSIEELNHLDFASITHPDDIDEDLNNMKLLNEGVIDSFVMDKRYITPKNEIVWINLKVKRLEDQQNHKTHFAMIEDITHTIEAQKQLVKSEQNLKTAQSIAKIGSWELEIGKYQLWGSEEAFKIYDLDRTSEYLDYDIIRNLADDSDRELLTQALADLIRENKLYDITFRILTKKGNLKYINSKANLVFDQDNKPFKVIGVIHDITELTNKNLELEYISNHDFLTGLYNRRYFVESYNKMDNPRYYPLGILMLDVNGLKIINDAYGHAVGDIALKKVSDMLQNSCRKDDIICRIGGDEFAVILPNVSQDELESIKTNIQEASTINKVNNIELSLATGYEIKDKDIEGDLEDILTLAENHMYRHKLAENVSVRNNAIKAILKTLTEKYEEERIHSAKVSQLCKEMGEVLDLSVENVKELEMAGMYHDIGKISIPDAILDKPGKLTDEEYAIIKTHPEISYQILRAADEYSDLAKHALHHHERWDGKGYPRKLKGEDIPLFSRIICIVDAYEAMTAVRSYKKQMSQDDAVKEIIKCSGSQFDEKLARVFVEKVLHKEWEI
ncbi:MAG: PAS domain S-box protein [Tenericutes bacterium]|nr:PAS domain S-box protein [Mycoplasmatota bacterium]